MTSPKSFSELTDSLIRIIHQAVAIEKKPVDLGYGDVLSASEIHLIDIAGRFPKEKLSEIASLLSITKGAVTQMVQKLEEKGYVCRVRSNENRKTVYLDLTPKGRKAFYGTPISIPDCIQNFLGRYQIYRKNRFTEQYLSSNVMKKLYREVLISGKILRIHNLSFFGT
jgi:Transcriptional regulators